MPEYRIVGKTLHVGRGGPSGEYVGLIIASRDAFFLLIDLTPKQALALQLGGLLGLLAAKAFKGLGGQQRDVAEIDYAELPPEIAEHPDWPVRRKEGRVIVIPREAIDHIESDFWGTYDLVCGDVIYCLGLNIIGRFKALSHLTDMGWDSKVDRSKTSPLLIQLALPLGLATGFLGAGLISVTLGAPWSGRHSVIEYAAIGAMIGLLGGLIVWIKAKRKRD